MAQILNAKPQTFGLGYKVCGGGCGLGIVGLGFRVWRLSHSLNSCYPP